MLGSQSDSNWRPQDRGICMIFAANRKVNENARHSLLNSSRKIAQDSKSAD